MDEILDMLVCRTDDWKQCHFRGVLFSLGRLAISRKISILSNILHFRQCVPIGCFIFCYEIYHYSSKGNRNEVIIRQDFRILYGTGTEEEDTHLCFHLLKSFNENKDYE